MMMMMKKIEILNYNNIHLYDLLYFIYFFVYLYKNRYNYYNNNQYY